MGVKSEVLYKVSYGLYIVSSLDGEKFNGQVANAVFQVTSEPSQVAVAINKKNLTHEYIKNSKVFSVSILEQDTPMKFIGLFGFRTGREVDKFKDVQYKIGKTGAPIVLSYAIGYFEAEVINSLDTGTHTVFVGKVISGELFNDKEPLTYDYYHKVKRGRAPKTAPTYREMTKSE